MNCLPSKREIESPCFNSVISGFINFMDSFCLMMKEGLIPNCFMSLIRNGREEVLPVVLLLIWKPMRLLFRSAFCLLFYLKYQIKVPFLVVNLSSSSMLKVLYLPKIVLPSVRRGMEGPFRGVSDALKVICFLPFVS